MIITDNGSYIDIGSRGIHKANVLQVEYDSQNVYLVSGKRAAYRNTGPSAIAIPYAEVTDPQSFASSVELRDWLLGLLNASGSHAPVFVDQMFTIAEKSANGTVIGTISASDPDSDPLTYTILSGNESGAFAINVNTGQITVNNSTIIDFSNPVGSDDYDRDENGDIIMAEGIPILSQGPGNAYKLTVTVSDGTNSTTALVVVCVTDVNELSQALKAKMLFIWTKSRNNGNLLSDLDSSEIIVTNNDFSSDYIPASSSSTFSIPNTSAFKNADTDNFWHSGSTILQKTPSQLVASNLTKTFVKYSDSVPYNIAALALLKAGEILTTSDKNELSEYFCLDIYYFGSTDMNNFGHLKDNKSY